MPLSTALPESGSKRSLRASTLLFTPASRRGDVHAACPSASWPQPCGMLTTPGMHRVGDLGRDARPRPPPTARAPAAPSTTPSAGRVVGMDLQRAARPCPSRAPRGCASTSCSTAGRAGRRARASPSPRRVERRRAAGRRRRRTTSGASSIMPVGVRSTSGRRGCSGPRSTPCGFASSTASERPSGSAPKPSP